MCQILLSGIAVHASGMELCKASIASMIKTLGSVLGSAEVFPDTLVSAGIHVATEMLCLLFNESENEMKEGDTSQLEMWWQSSDGVLQLDVRCIYCGSQVPPRLLPMPMPKPMGY